MALKGCLFDMDGVLVDSAKHHFVAWKRLADELSIPFTEEDNHALKGLSRVDSLEHILRLGNMELNEATKLKLMNHKNEWYLDLIQGMRKEDILPGAAELIQELSDAGIEWAWGRPAKTPNSSWTTWNFRVSSKSWWTATTSPCPSQIPKFS